MESNLDLDVLNLRLVGICQGKLRPQVSSELLVQCYRSYADVYSLHQLFYSSE